MFHLAAFSVSSGATADVDTPAVADQVLAINNGHFTLSQPLNLIGALVCGLTLTRAKLASPSMRQIASPFVRPVVLATNPPSNVNMAIWAQSPYRIPAYEEIQLLTTQTAVGPTRVTGLIWLSDGIQMAPRDSITPLRATSVTAAVANTWTDVTLTYTDTVPSGVYAMVLSEHASATAVAHRWIVSNQTWRPGFPSTLLITDRLPYAISQGQFGLMGTFRSNDLPRLQVLCTGADASHEVYLHVVRLGGM